MLFIAALFVVAAVLALLSGEARWVTGSVTRRGNPIAYWCSVATCLLAAALLSSVGPVR